VIYRTKVLHLLDTRPGVLARNVGLPDPVIYRTKVATTWDKYLQQVLKAAWPEEAKSDTQAACRKALLDAGTDPLTITIKACRERGIPIVASYRMNAEDFGRGGLDLSDFDRQHKDLRLPGANCLDPARPEVFMHRMAIFTEVANNYDIDGIEFDFRRWIHMVSRPHENHTVLTRMVRETRKMLDEVARKKGRKRLLLGARVGPTIAGNPMGPTDMSCKDLGLDVKTWIDEGLVDYLCPSLFWPRLPGLPRTREFVELARGTRVGVYPTVWPLPEWMEQGPDKGPVGVKDTRKLRRFRDDIGKAALQATARPRFTPIWRSSRSNARWSRRRGWPASRSLRSPQPWNALASLTKCRR
jgi:hypothetical protein